MPMILEVLQLYPENNDSNGTSKDPSDLGYITGFRRERKSFVVQLRGVYCELLSFFHNIITDNVVLSDEQRESLFPFDNERSEFLTAWNDLGTRDQSAIMKGLSQTEDSYQRVVKGLVSIQQAIFDMTSSESFTETFRQVIMSGRRKAMYYLKAHLSSQFKFTSESSKRREIEEQLEHITKIVEGLGDIRELPRSKRSKEAFPSIIETRRRFSAILYNSLEKVSKCWCHNFEATMLQLKPNEHDAKDDVQNLVFSIIFKFKPIAQRQQALPDVQETDIYIRPTYEPSNHGGQLTLAQKRSISLDGTTLHIPSRVSVTICLAKQSVCLHALASNLTTSKISTEIRPQIACRMSSRTQAFRGLRLIPC